MWYRILHMWYRIFRLRYRIFHMRYRIVHLWCRIFHIWYRIFTYGTGGLKEPTPVFKTGKHGKKTQARNNPKGVRATRRRGQAALPGGPTGQGETAQPELPGGARNAAAREPRSAHKVKGFSKSPGQVVQITPAGNRTRASGTARRAPRHLRLSSLLMRQVPF